MSEIKQPRFSWGQKVQHRENGTPFFIRSIYWEAHGGLWLYGPEHALPHWSEKQLTEVVEPLRAEFECEWRDMEASDRLFTDRRKFPTPVWSMHGALTFSDQPMEEVKKFVGKRTRVIVEEII